MISDPTANQPARVLRVALVVCLGLACAAALVGPVSGHAWLGIGICAGLLIGAGNGYAVERLIRVGVPFVATSLLRIVVLTAAALAAALLLGFSRAWTVVLGVAVAQLILAASAAGQMIRR